MDQTPKYKVGMKIVKRRTDNQKDLFGTIIKYEGITEYKYSGKKEHMYVISWYCGYATEWSQRSIDLELDIMYFDSLPNDLFIL